MVYLVVEFRSAVNSERVRVPCSTPSRAEGPGRHCAATDRTLLVQRSVEDWLEEGQERDRAGFEVRKQGPRDQSLERTVEQKLDLLG